MNALYTAFAVVLLCFAVVVLIGFGLLIGVALGSVAQRKAAAETNRPDDDQGPMLHDVTHHNPNGGFDTVLLGLKTTGTRH